MLRAISTVFVNSNQKWWVEESRFLALESISKDHIGYTLTKEDLKLLGKNDKVGIINVTKLEKSGLYSVSISAFDRQGTKFQKISGGLMLIVEDENHANEIQNVILKGINL